MKAIAIFSIIILLSGTIIPILTYDVGSQNQKKSKNSGGGWIGRWFGDLLKSKSNNHMSNSYHLQMLEKTNKMFLDDKK